jgi:hypothetical protein
MAHLTIMRSDREDTYSDVEAALNCPVNRNCSGAKEACGADSMSETLSMDPTPSAPDINARQQSCQYRRSPRRLPRIAPYTGSV